MSDDARRITSAQNPRVKLVKNLRDKRGREREGRFVVDDGRDLRRALDCGFEVDFVFYHGSMPQEFAQSIPPELAFDVSHDILEKVSYRENASSVVAVMRSKPSPSLKALVPLDNPLLLVLVALQKPGNIGALLRTADAAGVDAVLLVDTALDIYNPNIIRASTGTSFVSRIYATTSAEAIRFLKENAYSIVATLVNGDSDLYDTNLTGRIAIVMGTEDVGLDQGWANAADQRVTIPMMGNVSDSLNVSVSGAIMLYEALRQRRTKF